MTNSCTRRNSTGAYLASGRPPAAAILRLPATWLAAWGCSQAHRLKGSRGNRSPAILDSRSCVDSLWPVGGSWLLLARILVARRGGPEHRMSVEQPGHQ